MRFISKYTLVQFVVSPQLVEWQLFEDISSYKCWFKENKFWQLYEERIFTNLLTISKITLSLTFIRRKLIFYQRYNMAIIFFFKSLIISTWQSYFERFLFLTFSYTEKSQYSAVIVEFVPLTECFMQKDISSI